MTWSGPTKKRRRPLRDPGASTVPPFARGRRLAVAPGPESHLPPSRCARSPEQPVHRPWWRRIALPVIRRPLRTLQPVDHQRPALRRLGPALAGRTHDRGDARPPDASPPPLRDGRRARPLPRIGEDQKWQEGRISTPRDNSHAPVILRADRADRTTVLAAFSRLGTEESHISQASESFYRMKKAAEKDDEVDGRFSLCVHWGAALRLAASLRDANPHTWMDARPAPIQARLACRSPDVADSRHHELEADGLRISPATLLTAPTLAVHWMSKLRPIGRTDRCPSSTPGSRTTSPGASGADGERHVRPRIADRPPGRDANGPADVGSCGTGILPVNRENATKRST